jgi:hypothetical protein
MTTQKAILLGCGTVAVLVVLAVGGCGITLFRSFSNFPEYAGREAVYTAHKDVIDQVNALIAASDSLAAAQQSISAATWPTKVVYIKIKEDKATVRSKDGEGKAGPGAAPRPKGTSKYVDAFKRYAWTSNSVVSVNGSGYGTLGSDHGEVKIVIVDNRQLNAAKEEIAYTIYIEHPQK